ncbi:MAG: hypothetical protein ACRCTD_03475 [Beijerinckiaceae bacterium]
MTALDCHSSQPHPTRRIVPVWSASPSSPPDLQQAILTGRQQARLTLAQIVDGRMPLLWSQQRRLFGGGNSGR